MCLSYILQIFGMHTDGIERTSEGPVGTGPRRSTIDQQARDEQERMELQRLKEEQQRQDRNFSNSHENAVNEPLSTNSNAPKSSVTAPALSANPDAADAGANHLTPTELEKLKQINEREKKFSFFKRLFPKRSSDDKEVIGRFKKIITKRVNSLTESLPNDETLTLYKEDYSVEDRVNKLKKNVINARNNVSEALTKSNSIAGRKAVLELLKTFEEDVEKLKEYVNKEKLEKKKSQEERELKEKLKKGIKENIQKNITEKEVELKEIKRQLSEEGKNTKTEERVRYTTQQSSGGMMMGDRESYMVEVPKNTEVVEALSAEQSALSREIEGLKSTLASLEV